MTASARSAKGLTVSSTEIPLPHVEEMEYSHASQWQHQLDRQIHSKATVKAWDSSISVTPDPGEPIEFVPLGITAKPVISQHHRGSSRRRPSKPFPFVV